MEDKYYTPEEFSKIFKVSYRVVLKLIKSGYIRAFSVGNGATARYRIPQYEVLRIETVGIQKMNPNLKDDSDE